MNKNNAETYKIYLASRPDLGETVKEYYLNLIKKIDDNEKRAIQEALTILKDVIRISKLILLCIVIIYNGNFHRNKN